MKIMVMEVQIKYIKELKAYTKNEIFEFFDTEDKNKINQVVEVLINKKALRITEKKYYVFEFVGIIIINTLVLFSLPKYWNGADPERLGSTVLSLFKEYSKRENLDSTELEMLGNFDTMLENNRLATIIFLLDDFAANGLYSNQKDVDVLDGYDGINWTYTIESLIPIISNATPVYINYYTRQTETDDNDFFRSLHRYVIDMCSEWMESLGLNRMFGYHRLYFDSDLYFIEKEETVKSKVIGELSNQFVTRKQVVLKAILSFLFDEVSSSEVTDLCVYGTRSFHIVWEKVCAFVLDNKYDKLMHIIDKPKWIRNDGLIHLAKTFKPDIISIYKSEGSKIFIIFDAKYYNLKIKEHMINGNPGVEDIAKQYLYEMAFKSFVLNNEFSKSLNILLFPRDGREIECIGEVSIDFLNTYVGNKIKLVYLPASYVFERYIDGTNINLKCLVNCIDELERVSI